MGLLWFLWMICPVVMAMASGERHAMRQTMQQRLKEQTHRTRERRTNVIQGGDRQRVFVHPFSILLFPYCGSVTTTQEDEIVLALQGAWSSEFLVQVSAIASADELEFDYVLVVSSTMVPIDYSNAMLNFTGCALNITIQSALAVFNDPPPGNAPDRQSLTEWAMDAIGNHFAIPSSMATSESRAVVDPSSSILQTTNSPSVAPTASSFQSDDPNELVGPTTPGELQADEEDRAKIIVFCSITAAAVSLVSLTALLVVRARRSNRKDAELYPYLDDPDQEEEGRRRKRGRIGRSADLSSRPSRLSSGSSSSSDDSPDFEEQSFGMSPVLAATMAVQGGHSKSTSGRPHKHSTSSSGGSSHHQYRHSDNGSDNRSYADCSESSFTVATEAGDSMALKSIPSNPQYPPFPSNSADQLFQSASSASSSTVDPSNWPILPLAASQQSNGAGAAGVGQGGAASNTGFEAPIVLSSPESFEYDRPVNLRKDMLTSAWSGRMPMTEDSIRNDSVLQPSFFSASQERRRRRMEDGNQSMASSASNSTSSTPAMQSASPSSAKNTSRSSSRRSHRSSPTSGSAHSSSPSASPNTSIDSMGSPSSRPRQSPSSSSVGSPLNVSSASAPLSPSSTDPAIRPMVTSPASASSQSNNNNSTSVLPQGRRDDFFTTIVGMEEGSQAMTTKLSSTRHKSNKSFAVDNSTQGQQASPSQPPSSHHHRRSQSNSIRPLGPASSPSSANPGFVFSSANAGGEEIIMIPPRAKSRQDLV